MGHSKNFIKVEVSIQVYWEWEFLGTVLNRNGVSEKLCEVVMGTSYANVKRTVIRSLKKEKMKFERIDSVKIVGIAYG
jgi:hypothetical protein